MIRIDSLRNMVAKFGGVRRASAVKARVLAAASSMWMDGWTGAGSHGRFVSARVSRDSARVWTTVQPPVSGSVPSWTPHCIIVTAALLTRSVSR